MSVGVSSSPFCVDQTRDLHIKVGKSPTHSANL